MMEKQQEEKGNKREMEGGRGMSINDIVVGRRSRSLREYKRSAKRASETATEKPRFNAMDMEEMITSWKMCHRILIFIIHKAY